MAGRIEVRNLGKTFVTKDADVEALQDINLSIQAGENPRVIEEKLKSFLAPGDRVNQDDGGGENGE